jgi:hypothetical protein
MPGIYMAGSLKTTHTKFWSESLVGRDYLEIPSIGSVSGQRPVAGFSEHGSEPSGFLKGGEFRDYRSDS